MPQHEKESGHARSLYTIKISLSKCIPYSSPRPIPLGWSYNLETIDKCLPKRDW